jgi:hypothetical protein
MAVHIYSILCERVLFDEDKTPSLLRCFDRMILEMPTGEQPTFDNENIVGVATGVPLTLVTFWQRSVASVPEEADLQIEIRDPKSQVIAVSKVKVSLAGSQRARLLQKFEAFPCRGEGTHYVDVILQGVAEQTKVASLPVQIDFRKTEVAGTVPATT